MAVGLIEAQANALLDALCSAVAYTPPAAFWVQLHTGDPGIDGTSNGATEATLMEASFGAAAAGAVTTDADITWTSVAATETYTHVSYWDAETSGNFIASSRLARSRAAVAGDDARFVAGSLSLSLGPVSA